MNGKSPTTATENAAQPGVAQAEKARLTASIAGARAELQTTLHELRTVMRAELDWREWVGGNPMLSVAIAAALGWRIGRGRWL